jgi:hypothetical protein
MKGAMRWALVILFSPEALLIILIASSALFLAAAWVGLMTYASLTVREPSSRGSTR